MDGNFARRGLRGPARAALILLAFIALPTPAQDVGLRVITMTITSSGAHKECVSLSTTQSLRYWYRSDAPIDFNLQYQDAGRVAYVVRRNKRAIGTGSYRAKTADVHCMVLSNPAQKPVTVRLEFARVDS